MLQSQKWEWMVNVNDNIWKKLWKIKAPPKTLNLVWRALSKCLLTLSQLQEKQVQIQALCPVCQIENETMIHCLVTCSFARQCWLILLPDLHWDTDVDFKTWLELVLQSENAKRKAEAITLCWAIWRSEMI